MKVIGKRWNLDLIGIEGKFLSERDSLLMSDSLPFRFRSCLEVKTQKKPSALTIIPLILAMIKAKLQRQQMKFMC
jgi:hypothetical protein